MSNNELLTYTQAVALLREKLLKIDNLKDFCSKK